MSLAAPAARANWRTPLLILACGAAFAAITFGPRSSMGLFLAPLSSDLGWGRDVFALAIAVQNLLWGLGQPFAGAVADRFGATRVLAVGALLYAAGLFWMAFAQTPGELHLSAGVLIGFGLSGCSFNIVLGAFGKLLPPSKRPLAFGIGTAAGSFGQFFFAPLGSALISSIGWQNALIVFGCILLLILPLSLVLATPRVVDASPLPGIQRQSIRQALGEAFAERSYVLLVLGFFTCGFQLAFITTHLPPYLADIGLDPWIGGWTIAVIGLANIVGSLSSGYLSGRVSKVWLLVVIYALRGVAIAVFILLPASPVTAIGFGIAIGVLWLSTIPPTSGLVVVMFGTGYMTMLYGFAFFSHQVGAFLGVWLGGVLYEAYGSYNLVWWLSVALSFASAAINMPIREQPVARLSGAPAAA
jgi:predicted MFS family arabinose efflux permease